MNEEEKGEENGEGMGEEEQRERELEIGKRGVEAERRGATEPHAQLNLNCGSDLSFGTRCNMATWQHGSLQHATQTRRVPLERSNDNPRPLQVHPQRG